MRRRDYLRALGGAGTVGVGSALAGCAGLLETRSARAPPLVSDRPDGVYVPTHVEGMQMGGVASAGRLRLAVSYSFPHRFWRLEGEDTQKVEIQSDDTVHLMVSAWDAETGMVVPASSPTLSATKDGETVLSGRSLWRMLSQNMGLHFGDNVTLDGDGEYEVTVDYGPIETRRTGVFQEAFGEQVEVSVSFEFTQALLEETSFRRLEDRQGERGAVDPMQMDMLPVPRLRPAESLPGGVGATGESGDATVVATVLDERPDGIDGDGQYLVVSPRTPYNRFPLANMAVDASVGEFDGELTPTLSPTLDYHYGAAVEGVAAGDALTITPVLPPQLSRHEGYETAFLDMPAMDLTLSER